MYLAEILNVKWHNPESNSQIFPAFAKEGCSRAICQHQKFTALQEKKACSKPSSQLAPMRM